MTSAAPLPDAAPSNWVDRFAPASLRPWLKLGRFDRPTGIWLLMLPGWQGIALAAAEQGRRPDRPGGFVGGFPAGRAAATLCIGRRQRVQQPGQRAGAGVARPHARAGGSAG